MYLASLLIPLAFLYGSFNSETYYENLPHTVPEEGILVFYQKGCDYCVRMIPVLKRLEEEDYTVHAIDIYKQPDIAAEFGVLKTPTIIKLPEGYRVDGYVEYNDLKRVLRGERIEGEGCLVGDLLCTTS